MAKKKSPIWGLGIEAEFAVFHSTEKGAKRRPIRFLFFDPRKELSDCMVKQPHVRLFSYLFYYPYTRRYRGHKLVKFPERFIDAVELAKDAEIETATRTCGDMVLFGKNPNLVYYLTELKTVEPFSYPGRGWRYMEKYTSAMQKVIRLYLHDVNKYRPSYMRKESKVIGGPDLYPYGMSSRILLRNLDTDKFGKWPVVTNYTGSYHFTFTLPFKPGARRSCQEHVNKHKHFANLIQWLEPLLGASLMTCDDRAVGQGHHYTRGSFRMVMSGWGTFGGSDINQLTCPKPRKIQLNELAMLALQEEAILGKRASRDPDWRNRLPFKGVDRLDRCRRIDPEVGNSDMGSDIRVRLFLEPFQPDKKMYTVMSGVEVRILDWFHPRHLPVVGRIFVMIAELSRTRPKQRNVYHDRDWTKAVRAFVLDGWRAILPEGYVKKLEKVLGLNIPYKDLRAYSVFQALLKVLYEETKDGEWTNLLLSKKYHTPPTTPRVNQRSWEFAFLQYLLSNPRYQQKLKRFLYQIERKSRKHPTLKYTTIRSVFHRTFSSSRNWKQNLPDILYFLEVRRVLRVEHTDKGNIHRVKNFNAQRSRWVQQQLGGKILKDLLRG
jgi:hypothetical protein